MTGISPGLNETQHKDSLDSLFTFPINNKYIDVLFWITAVILNKFIKHLTFTNIHTRVNVKFNMYGKLSFSTPRAYWKFGFNKSSTSSSTQDIMGDMAENQLHLQVHGRAYVHTRSPCRCIYDMDACVYMHHMWLFLNLCFSILQLRYFLRCLQAWSIIDNLMDDWWKLVKHYVMGV